MSGLEGGGLTGGGVGGSYQPGVYVPLKALFLVPNVLVFRSEYCVVLKSLCPVAERLRALFLNHAIISLHLPFSPHLLLGVSYELK